MNVLVMDDEPEIVSTLAAWLGKTGHRAHAVTSPSTLLSLLRRGGYDALFVDLMMPGANGLSLISEVRAVDRVIPIVVISAIEDTRVAATAAGLGADLYLTKPIDFDNLSNALAQLGQHCPA